ncbi:MAG: hypothetical protein ACD_11C00020G0053 [uncultured bacterium]|nr:MAG: hypothetical protein ACD_11C00020G0053 [uncultured bacterium]HBR71338.1 hypothetical protein [Candidatus Moranbacteria bacterium]
MNNQKEKNKFFKDTRFLARVFVVGIIFSITALLILLDAFKQYRADVAIIVIPKNEIIAQQSKDVMENIMEFPQMLSFYDNLIKFNPEIEDNFSGQNSDKRKNNWNDIVKVSKDNSEKGTLINVSVLAKKSGQAEIMAAKTAHTLFGTVSKFYNIKTDLEISIAEGPIVSVVLRNWGWIAIASLIIGFVFSFLLNFALELIEKIVRPSGAVLKSSPIRGLRKKFEQKQHIEIEKEKNDEFKYDMPYDFEDVYPNFPEMPKDSIKKSSAPENLPVADDVIFFEETEIKKEKQIQEKDVIEMKKEEPTQEELKARLNKLLNGDM